MAFSKGHAWQALGPSVSCHPSAPSNLFSETSSGQYFVNLVHAPKSCNLAMWRAPGCSTARSSFCSPKKLLCKSNTGYHVGRKLMPTVQPMWLLLEYKMRGGRTKVFRRILVIRPLNQAGGVSWMTVRRYFASGTMTISCFFVRSRSNFSPS